jgi:hypothetical protein
MRAERVVRVRKSVNQDESRVYRESDHHQSPVFDAFNVNAVVKPVIAKAVPGDRDRSQRMGRHLLQKSCSAVAASRTPEAMADMDAVNRRRAQGGVPLPRKPKPTNGEGRRNDWTVR